MNKKDLVKSVAKQRGVEPATAADQVDRAVSNIVQALRRGKNAHLPGVGTIKPGKPWILLPEKNENR